MSSEQEINALMHKKLRQSGLNLKVDAAAALKAFVLQKQAAEPEISLQQIVNEIVTAIKGANLTSAFVTLDMAKEIVTTMSKALASAGGPGNKGGQGRNQATEGKVVILDAFSKPRFTYHTVDKVMIRDTPAAAPAPAQGEGPSTRRFKHGSATDKADMLRDRFHTISQRLFRHENFRVISSGHQMHQHHTIVRLESLIGRSGIKCIFGMLVQREKGVFFIEDLNAEIAVDLSNTQITSGLFVENCFVLAEGTLEDDVFVVNSLGFPPPETRENTLKAFNNLSYCGLPISQFDLEREQKLLLAAQADPDCADMFVIVSDVHLDKPKVMAALALLFSGMEHSDPLLFVFMGDFTSKPLSLKQQTECFDELADLLAKTPRLAQYSKFLFLAGPSSPGLGKVLPANPLPSSATQRLRDRLRHCTIGSNPCQMMYHTQQFTFFREDLLHKMRRNCVLSPNLSLETDDLTEHLVKTVCDQAHLCPLPLHIQPVYWNYDHAMSLYPLPNVLVLADTVDQYEWSYEGCHCFNPGSFSVDQSFVVYWPAQMRAEFSRVD